MLIKTEQISIWQKELEKFGAGVLEPEQLTSIQNILSELLRASSGNKSGFSANEVKIFEDKLSFRSKCQKAYFGLLKNFFSLDKAETDRLIQISTELQTHFPSLKSELNFYAFMIVVSLGVKRSETTFGYFEDEFSVDKIDSVNPEALARKLIREIPSALVIRSFFSLLLARLSLESPSISDVKHLVEDHLMEIESEGLGFFLMDFRKNLVSGKSNH